MSLLGTINCPKNSRAHLPMYLVLHPGCQGWSKDIVGKEEGNGGGAHTNTLHTYGH